MATPTDLDDRSDRRRDLKKQATRRRLITAGLRLFEEQGYDATTAAQIADAAGVTERTFFRHFRAKSDLVLAGWRRNATSVDEAMRNQPQGTPPIEVVRAGLRAFAERLAVAINEQPEQSMTTYAGQVPALEMLAMMVSLESVVARELGQRLALSEEDIDVRIAANASVGVLRAAGRAQLLQRRSGMIDTVDESLNRLSPLFDQLVNPHTATLAEQPIRSPRTPPAAPSDQLDATSSTRRH